MRDLNYGARRHGFCVFLYAGCLRKKLKIYGYAGPAFVNDSVSVDLGELEKKTVTEGCFQLLDSGDRKMLSEMANFWSFSPLRIHYELSNPLPSHHVI